MGIIYSEIFKKNESEIINGVFLGSSKTLYSIDDQYISNQLGNYKNFGVQHYGQDLRFLILKELLKNRKVETVFLEVSKLPFHVANHELLPYLGTIKDIYELSPNAFRFLDNMLTYSKINLDFFLNSNKSTFKLNPVEGYANIQYGFKTPKKVIFNPKKVKPPRKVKEQNRTINRIIKKIDVKIKNYNLRIIQKMAELCKQYNTRFIITYFPLDINSNHTVAIEEINVQITKNIPLVVPDLKIFNNTENWGDSSHLNMNGASELSRWYKKFLKEKTND